MKKLNDLKKTDIQDFSTIGTSISTAESKGASTGESIGQKLRYYREARKLAQTEVSNALCLSVKIIDALERDDHGDLPEVFVKGYLRNYAAFLHLSEEELLISARKNKTSKKSESGYSRPSPKKMPEKLKSTLLKIPVNYIIIFVLAAVLFAGWDDRHDRNQREDQKEISLLNMSSQEIPFKKIQPDIPPDVNDNTSLLKQIRPWWIFNQGENQ